MWTTVQNTVGIHVSQHQMGDQPDLWRIFSSKKLN